MGRDILVPLTGHEDPQTTRGFPGPKKQKS
jgi:hypothetical protein